jgi:predicted nucleic acid-binding protein
MNLFLDANVLISVLNKEFPTYSFAARILSLADDKKFKIYTSPICLAIAFYFSEKKSGSKIAKSKIDLLTKKVNITTVGKQEVNDSLNNKKVKNIEDGFEYYSAINSHCDAIITEDTNDFYFSILPIYSCKNFIQKYLLN